MIENRGLTACAVCYCLLLAVTSFADEAGKQGDGQKTIMRTADTGTRAHRAPTRPGKTAAGSKPPGGVPVAGPPLSSRTPTAARPRVRGILLADPFLLTEPPTAQAEELPLVAPADALAPGRYQEPSAIQPPDPTGRTNQFSTGAGALQLDVQPWNALVYVDGFYVGSVEMTSITGGVMLSPGWHRLELRAPGYQTPALNITILANQTNRARFALQPIP